MCLVNLGEQRRLTILNYVEIEPTKYRISWKDKINSFTSNYTTLHDSSFLFQGQLKTQGNV